MNNHSIKDKVLNKIKSGEIKIKPKLYFILKTVLVILGSIVVGIFILFLISFISFTLRASGLWFLPNFGFHGFGIFLGSLPWILIVAALLLIAALEIFMKRFSLVYRKPVLYSLLAIVLIVFVGGFIIDQTTFHSKLFLKAREGKLPLAGPMYRGFGMPEFHNVHRGVVSEITENGFILETPQTQKLTIIIGSQTKTAPDFEVQERDEVVVFGEKTDSTINALNIRKIDDNLELFPAPPQVLPPHMFNQFK